MYRILKNGEVIQDNLCHFEIPDDVLADMAYDVQQYIPCRGEDCSEDGYERQDWHGISTGYWCDGCFNSDKYPYRKDDYYDPGYAGERLEPDY